MKDNNWVLIIVGVLVVIFLLKFNSGLFAILEPRASFVITNCINPGAYTTTCNGWAGPGSGNGYLDKDEVNEGTLTSPGLAVNATLPIYYRITGGGWVKSEAWNFQTGIWDSIIYYSGNVEALAEPGSTPCGGWTGPLQAGQCCDCSGRCSITCVRPEVVLRSQYIAPDGITIRLRNSMHCDGSPNGQAIISPQASFESLCNEGEFLENGMCFKIPEPKATKIIKLSMTNIGSQKLYDITLQQGGTIPSDLYNAFSNLKQFELIPGGQVIFYANLDTSTYNGTIPFQMMFNTKYSIDNNTYSLTKFTDPLILNFNNGVII